MNQPIVEFESQEQLDQCLAEWQKRLFLEHWIIVAKVVRKKNIGKNMCGENHFVIENSTCSISILDKRDYDDDRITKYCPELTLVHELLHCKYNWLAAPSTPEGIYMDTLEHVLIEQMAKSLIMAKYGISLDWFKNP